MIYEDIEELAFKDTSEMLEQNKLVLLDIIDILQYDRKQWINQYTQGHNDYVLLQQENKRLKERIRILTEHPFISALNNGTAFNKKEISFIIRIDNGKAFKVEKELFDYITDLERKNIFFKTKMLEKEEKGIKLQKEKQQLKEELKIKQDDFKCADEEINRLKEAIEKVREKVEQVAAYPYANFDIETTEGFCQVSISKWFDDLLQILDKVGDNNV